MRILYVTAGIPVPGTVGGSTHVVEVARGLAALGHEVLTVAGPPEDAGRKSTAHGPRPTACNPRPSSIWRCRRRSRS